MIKVETLLPSARGRLLTIAMEALLVDAAALLNLPDGDIVVVCDAADRMAGVVTKSDVVARIGSCTGHSCMMAVTNVMSRDVVFCRPDDGLEDIWMRMRDRSLKNVPVVDDDLKPLGILTARETVQRLLEDARYEENFLRDYVMSVGYR